MSYLKFNSRINNNNDDINIYQNNNLNLDLQNKNKTSYNNLNPGVSSNLNFQNTSSNFNKINGNENFSNFHTNSNFSSSLKDQILSPGDDDISSNLNKTRKNDKNASPYLDDDIVFNQLNFHYLNKNKNNLSLIDGQKNQNNEYSKHNINLPMNKEIKYDKKTLILDLDETLVHSSFKPINYNNILHKPDIFLSINFRNNNHNVFVLKRPYVHEFLKEMNKFYNIVIFTASVKEYANPLLDTLDTEKVIKKRLFREDCCIGPNGKYVKDLKILNMNLKDLILVDNNPISYSYNKCNGVPIQTWHFDKTDQELIKLIPVLQFLADVNDVRNYIPKLVENDEIDFSKINYLINEFNNENQQNKQRPRAKSQTKFMNTKRPNNKNTNYGINNNLNKNNINNLNINTKQRKIFEETKVNLEMNKNNQRNYETNQNINSNNIRPIKNMNNKNANEEYKERNVIDFNHTNKYYNEHNNNNTNFNFNNYLNETNTLSKNNSLNLYLKAHLKEKANLMKNEDEIREQTAIESYKKKYNILSLKNNYLNNECRNYQRNKTQDISKMKKAKKEDNAYMNNYQKNGILNGRYNLDINQKNNNNIKSNCNIPNLNENIKNNYAIKFEDEQKENNNYNGNYIHNYKTKINYTYTTPQISKKYMSNFKNIQNNEIINTNFNYNQSNININIEYKNNLVKNNIIKNNKDNNNNIDNNIFYINNNSNKEDNNINSFNRNNFYKELNNEFNHQLKNDKENGINKINIETPKQQKNSNKIDLNINNNGSSNNNNNIDIVKIDSIKDYNIMHSNTAINFFPSKFNSNNMYNDILSHNLYNKEESKINNIFNNGLNYLKLDNNLKRENSPYKISKETNYYIKRKMKLNKEKVLNKNKDKDKDKGNEIKNDLYMTINGNKGVQKDNYLNGVNNFIYNINQKYFGNGNENYFYINNNY